MAGYQLKDLGLVKAESSTSHTTSTNQLQVPSPINPVIIPTGKLVIIPTGKLVIIPTGKLVSKGK